MAQASSTKSNMVLPLSNEKSLDLSNVPPMMRQNSGKRIINKRPENLPTKTLRMKSLLWMKPTITSSSSNAPGKGSLFRQLLPTLLVNIAAISAGISLGYSAVALPQLETLPSAASDIYLPFEMGKGDGSWIASVFGIGAIFGSMLSGYLGSHIGRRKTLLIMAIPDILGWILIAASQNLLMMLTGRFLCGIATAAYIPAIQVYTSEISEPHNRGLLTAVTVPCIALGSFIVYVLGATLSWHIVASVAVIVPILIVPALIAIPDSPYWYLQINQDKKALKVLEYFRKKDTNVLEEFITMSHTWNTEDGNNKKVSTTNPSEVVEKLMQRKFRRPFIILNCLFLLMSFSGKFAVSFYAVDIFHMAHVGLNEYFAAAVIGFIRLFGALLYVPAIKFFSRRSLLCWSSIVMGCSLVALGLTMYSMDNTDMSESTKNILHWAPLLCVTLFTVADPLGLGSVPFLYSAEFFPSELRSLLSGFTLGLSNLEMFLVLKTFPGMMNSTTLGGHGTFWLYAGVCFATVIFTLLFVPETKGKSLEEIEGLFAHKESLYVTPYVTPVATPLAKKKNSQYPHMSIQFTL